MIRVILASAPIADQRRAFELDEDGLTLAEIVARALPQVPDADLPRLRVTLGGARDAVVVPHPLWRAVRPKPGALVVIRDVAGDPISLGIAVMNTLGAIGIPATMGFAIGMNLPFIGLGLVAVSALAKSLIPVLPKQHQLPEGEELYQLDGWQNQANPGEAIPWPAGQIRMAPLYAARPYSEVIDGKLYLSALFLWGHGRLAIADLKIKDTPLSHYTGVTVISHEATAGGASLQMIREQVIEDRLGTELQPANPDWVWQSWSSPQATDRIRVILQFPGGLFYISTKDGKLRASFVDVYIRARLRDTGDWIVLMNERLTGGTNSGFFRQFDWRMPSRGIWEIEFARITGPSNSMTTNTVVLFAVAGIRERSPIAYDGPLAVTELRMRADALANGSLDTFNGIVHRYALAWNGATWTEALTRNPAGIAMAAMLSPAWAHTIDPTQIHQDEFAELYNYCAEKGLKFDRVLAGDQTFGEALHSILAAGRATWRRDGRAWGTVIDRPQPYVTDRLSPVSASSIRWSRSYLRRPDAFSITFRDETNGWEEVTGIVPWRGFSGTPQVLEELRLEGKTDPREVWIEARRRQDELDLRPDTFTVVQPGALRHAMRGDAVALSCDLLDAVQVAARVRQVDGRLLILDAPVTMEEGVQYAVKWQSYDADDPLGAAVQASVVTAAGEGVAILLATGSEVPEIGAEVHFGRATRVDFACRLVSAEPAEDMAWRLTLTNDAPEIEARANAAAPTDWVSRYGETYQIISAPEVPVIGAIRMIAADYDYGSEAAITVSVPVAMPATNSVSIDRIDVRHRLVGSAEWSVTVVPGSGGEAVLDCGSGDTVELYATAVSVFGGASAASGIVVAEVVGTIARPTPLPLASMSASGGLGWAEVALSTASDTAEVQLFRVPSGVELDTDTHAVGGPRSVPSGSSMTALDGDSSRATLFDLEQWTATDVTIVDGVASHEPGQPGTVSHPISVTAGETLRGEVTVTGLSAGNVTLVLAGGASEPSWPITTSGAHLVTLAVAVGTDRVEIIWSEDCDAAIHLGATVLFKPSATSAPAGEFEYYVAPIDSEQIANTPTGPLPVRII